jgi:hypothetical protein
MVVASFVIALFALGVAGTALGVQIWERFRAKPDIWPAFSWHMPAAGGCILRLTLVNTGFRQGIVTEVGISSPFHANTWTNEALLAPMPLVIPPDSASDGFEVDMTKGPPEVLDAIGKEVDPGLDLIVNVLRRLPAELGETKLVTAREQLRFPIRTQFYYGR